MLSGVTNKTDRVCALRSAIHTGSATTAPAHDEPIARMDEGTENKQGEVVVGLEVVGEGGRR